MGFFSTSTALRHRDFRLIWIGLLLSQSGSMMQTAGILWHVYELTGSALALGTVGLVRIIPVIGFSLLSGVLADTMDRRKLMMVAQSGMAVCAFLLGCTAVLQVKAVWPLYVLAALSSSFAAFDLPARQALLPSLVPREDLPNAFSLNATMFQAASIVGPALSGLIIAQFGLAWVYWMNAISFVAILVALSLITYRQAAVENKPRVSLNSAMEGLRFVRNHSLILSSMLLDFFATFFSAATALLPIYAKDILHVGPIGYGWLYASEAVGALIVGIGLSLSRKINTSGKLLLVMVFFYGISTIVFGYSRLFWLSFLALAAVGATDTVSMVIRNTIRQLNTPDELRGRMVSVNMIFFMGGPQLGEMEAGLVANWFGATISVVSGGAACAIAVVAVGCIWPALWRYQSEA